MTSTKRAMVVSEIARLEAASPSRIAAFNESRAARLRALREELARLPTEALGAVDTTLEHRRALDRKNEQETRRMERRGW